MAAAIEGFADRRVGVHHTAAGDFAFKTGQALCRFHQNLLDLPAVEIRPQGQNERGDTRNHRRTMEVPPVMRYVLRPFCTCVV
ncbi:MAG TPA: hypothetical protein VN442_18040 [Bryobacteraceae bacterium]|nr:hypothetical protein [Bryobacteraceae bacterium]